MQNLLNNIANCTLCANLLPHPPRPVVSVSPSSRIIIVGQAPGARVHDSGVPWDDRSGEELRRWLGVSNAQFYDSSLFALMPMGFCYPGRGKSGDLPPRPECAPTWHDRLRQKMKEVELVLLVGQYAQAYYLEERRGTNLTETVRNFRSYLPEYFPLVHPSPRNKIWQKRNPWFEAEVLIELREIVGKITRRG
ncbi:MAG: uracil-DNA glycosylase family protein [Candidatus Kapaibacterium sp.]